MAVVNRFMFQSDPRPDFGAPAAKVGLVRIAAVNER